MPDSVRHLHSVKENMNHRHAELLQAVDKARIVCDEARESPWHCPLGKDCDFHLGAGMLGCRCGLDDVEEILKKEGM
jgi:hypothetical protein